MKYSYEWLTKHMKQTQAAIKFFGKKAHKSDIKLRLPSECLLENYLDKVIQDVLSPLELTHAILFQSKFRIRDHFITPNGMSYSILSFLVTLIFTLILINTIFTHDLWGMGTLSFGPLFHYVVSIVVIVSLFMANIANADSNVTLILHIQAARRAFDSLNHENDVKSLILINRMISGFFLVFVIFQQILSAFILKLGVAVVVTNIAQYHYDVTIVYAFSVAKLINIQLKSWLTEMNICKKSFDNSSIDPNLASQNWVKLEKAFFELSKALKDYQNVFSVPVCITCY